MPAPPLSLHPSSARDWKKCLFSTHTFVLFLPTPRFLFLVRGFLWFPVLRAKGGEKGLMVFREGRVRKLGSGSPPPFSLPLRCLSSLHYISPPFFLKKIYETRISLIPPPTPPYSPPCLPSFPPFSLCLFSFYTVEIESLLFPSSPPLSPTSRKKNTK